MTTMFCRVCNAEVEVEIVSDIYLYAATQLSHPYLQMYKCKPYNHFVGMTEAGKRDWNRWVLQQLKEVRRREKDV